MNSIFNLIVEALLIVWIILGIIVTALMFRSIKRQEAEEKRIRKEINEEIDHLHQRWQERLTELENDSPTFTDLRPKTH